MTDCILTTKDFTILEVMRDRRACDDPLVPLLDRKLGQARVVFREDVPDTVATLGSRVAFHANGGAVDTRIICHDDMDSAVGLFLPITTARGLALLGLGEGGMFRYAGADGGEHCVVLERVLHQPEAVRRARDAAARQPQARPQLRLIRGAFDGLPPASGPTPPAGRGWREGPDDPGPSAA